jgi:hypothetical protein
MYTKVMNKKINFKARSKTEFETQEKPYPAVKSIPQWFKNQDPYEAHPFDETINDGKVHVRGRVSNATFKKCVPLLDGMSAGYIVPLWTDVEVVEGDIPGIFWKTKRDVFLEHGKNTQKMTPPAGYNSQVYKYLNCWIPQTPKGYSCLFISPIGHNDLPFKAVPAIVDTDKASLELIFPVWVKDNFSGIVEKGTPIVQIIPFKRDDWDSTFDYYEDGDYHNIIEEKNFNTTIVGHYIKNVWSKKKFK